MFPFLEPKRSVSLMIDKKGDLSHQAIEKNLPKDEDMEPFRALAQDMLSAIENKSASDLAHCMKALHDMMAGEDAEQDKTESHDDSW